MKKYLVGGAVRDQLLGRQSNDNDYVVVGSTPGEMTAAGFKQVGADFPVFIHPHSKEEYALARKEIKSGTGHKGFAFDFSPSVTLKEDLIRRDLTINAIAKDDKGNITDPFMGQVDIKNKILRHVSDHFGEDPLRVVRVARFAAQLPDFKISEETIALMTKMSQAQELSTLTSERVYMEFEKAMKSNSPWRFFETLFQCQAITQLFPEVAALKDIPQSPEFHPEGDALTHTQLVLEHACKLSRDPDLRIAALMHDLGKANTPKDILPKHTGHEVRGVEIIEKIAKRLRMPNRTKKLATLVANYHLRTHQSLELSSENTLQILTVTRALTESKLFEQYIKCCKADDLGKLSINYPPEKYLLKCQRELVKQDHTNLQKSFSGKQLGIEIRRVQLELIDTIKKGFMK